jgi:hypothetical protein
LAEGRSSCLERANHVPDFDFEVIVSLEFCLFIAEAIALLTRIADHVVIFSESSHFLACLWFRASVCVSIFFAIQWKGFLSFTNRIHLKTSTNFNCSDRLCIDVFRIRRLVYDLRFRTHGASLCNIENQYKNSCFLVQEFFNCL